MPPKKKVSRASRPVRASKNVSAPENVPFLELQPVARVLHFEHIFASAAAFIFVFSILLSVASHSKAQEFQAAVSATVLPIDSYSNYRLLQMNPFQRWWSTLTTYQKLMYQSGAGLTAVVVPLGVLLALQQHKQKMSHVAVASNERGQESHA